MTVIIVIMFSVVNTLLIVVDLRTPEATKPANLHFQKSTNYKSELMIITLFKTIEIGFRHNNIILFECYYSVK